MPTPFTHLEAAQRLLGDPQVPAELRALLRAQREAFLLGSVAADARVSSGLRREETHFYAYDQPIEERPWRAMFRRHPSLLGAAQAQRAFLAGYIAHLTMDETWSLAMVRPHFVGRPWRTPEHRFVMLHIILIFMDERDEQRLETWQHSALAAARPAGWLPFMPDADLTAWRDFIAGQIAPGGCSQTLDVFGARIPMSPSELRAILDSPARLHDDLWQYIDPTLLTEVEGQMYAAARADLVTYLHDDNL